VVGNDLDLMSGIYHQEENLRTYTLWGELAYQLGGREGYEKARENDEGRTAPGTGLFEELVGERPTLIMIDEIARHLRAASAVPTPSGKSDMAQQTVAFLMSLMEYVAGQKQVVLVLTLAGVDDAFGKETAELREALKCILNHLPLQSSGTTRSFQEVFGPYCDNLGGAVPCCR
jgi:hypothetical protein